MKYLLNFSHPLTDKQRTDLVQRLGDFNELHFPAQFDMEAVSLRQQVYDLLNAATNEVRGNSVVAVIPPSLSAAAYWVAQDLHRMGWHDVPAIWLRREGSAPPRFVVGGVE